MFEFERNNLVHKPRVKNEKNSGTYKQHRGMVSNN